MRRRADHMLVERGLFESRARAQAAIAAGLVTVAGKLVTRPSELIAPDAPIAADADHPYVSRGGVKLAAALDQFALDPSGLPCLDCGASTGGFTDVLLRRGAASVTAVDVGRGQLHRRLAADPRVASLEGVDIRTLDAKTIPAPPRLVVADVSFISLALVIPALSRLAAADAALVALVKPQFEVGRAAIGKGGIVKDQTAAAAALDRIAAAVAAAGWTLLGRMESPVAGGDGNREFLIGARRGGPS